MIGKALDTLTRLLDAEADAVRCRAAIAVLDLAAKAGAQELEARLDALERTMAGRNMR